MSLTDLSKIFEWTVGVHLGRIKNVELILLKGHLMLEVAINYAIHTLDKHNTSKLKDLSFHRKLQILDSLRQYAQSDLKEALGHLRNLNILRNRLAHEFMFDGGAEDLGRWSEAVLVDFPGTKFCRHTFRTKIVQAFGALARLLVDPLSSEEIVFGEGSIGARATHMTKTKNEGNLGGTHRCQVHIGVRSPPMTKVHIGVRSPPKVHIGVRSPPMTTGQQGCQGYTLHILSLLMILSDV